MRRVTAGGEAWPGGGQVGVEGPSRRPRPWTVSSPQDNLCPRPLEASSRHAAQLGAGGMGSPEAGMESPTEAPPTEPASWCRPRRLLSWKPHLWGAEWPEAWGFSDPWDGFLPSGPAAGGVDTTLLPGPWALGPRGFVLSAPPGALARMLGLRCLSLFPGSSRGWCQEPCRRQRLRVRPPGPGPCRRASLV